jgi:hypothetical protein
MLPADQFSFAYTFIYTVSVGLEVQPPTKLDAHIALEVIDAAGSVKAIFEAYEYYSIVVGQLQLIWAWISNQEKFTGVDAAGAAIETEGQFSNGVDPASGTEVALGDVAFSSTFYSLIFNFDLEEGDRIRIKFHNVSAGFVTNKASLKIATRQSETRTPGLFDSRTGAQFRTFAKDGETRLVYSRQAESPLDPEKVENHLVAGEALKSLSLMRGSGGATFVLGKSGSLLKMFRSYNEGKSSKEIMSVSADITPLASCLSADGGTWFIYGVNVAKMPAYAILKNSGGAFKLSETGICGGTDLPTSKVNALASSDGGELRLLATGPSRELLLFLSNDGKVYKSVEAIPNGTS